MVTVAIKLKDTPWKKSYDKTREQVKKQRHYFGDNFPYIKGLVFPVVMYGCESWTIKKAECWRIDAFELWCWRLLRVPWIERRSNQSILKEINPEYSLEGLMLKLKLQYFDHLMWWIRPIGKDPDSGTDWRQEEKVMTEDEMVGSHHRLIEHEFQQTAGDGEGQGNLAFCSPWGCKESDMTEQLNDNSYLVYLMCTPTLSSLFFAINSRGRIMCTLPLFFSSSFFSFIFLILSHVSSFFSLLPFSSTLPIIIITSYYRSSYLYLVTGNTLNIKVKGCTYVNLA